MNQNTTTLIWYRRDLRLDDHSALLFALDQHERVVPVYIHAPDEEEPWVSGSASQWWLHHSLNALADTLHKRRSKLVIRRGPSLPSLLALCEETGASNVFWHRLYEPSAISRDREIKSKLKEHGINAKSFGGHLLLEPWNIRTGNGTPYKVYTAYWKACRRMPQPELPRDPPDDLRPPRVWPASESLDALDLLPKIPWDIGIKSSWQPGEKAAMKRLTDFLDHILEDYSVTRDLPGTDGVSRLSPYLHFGELSPRRVWNAVQAMAIGEGIESKAEAYLRQLAWRDFAHYLLCHFPDTHEHNFRTEFDNFPWLKQENDDYKAWCQGLTGIPLVDAGMRELWATGWMHNRVRMTVASLLTKNIGLHWLLGARWFWDTLVDANLANNTLGWQWTAGCGADAAPYFRIFNPIRQGQRFDPRGDYVRRWVPELSGLPDSCIHAPWTAPSSLLVESGVKLGVTYPLPIVDLQRTRERALSAYASMKRAHKN